MTDCSTPPEHHPKLPPGQAARIRAAVVEKYREVSLRAEGHFPYPVGRASALGLGYEVSWLSALPAGIVERFVGVGNPFSLVRPRPGERVLDVGCGAGLDLLVASLLVGQTGLSVGVDLTPAMVEWARQAAGVWTMGPVELHEGSVEALPLADASFDVVISNGSLNLVPDKDAAFSEIARVLRPGGTFAAADLVVLESLPAEVAGRLDAWSG